MTAAEIARLAGVGRAAVSNWRKRHADFPAPTGGTAASPRFDLAQIEHWLWREGKLVERSVEERAWSHLVASDSDLTAGLATVGEALARNAACAPPIAELVAERGAAGAFDALLRRLVHARGQRSHTADSLADLMVGVAEVGGKTVLDPACGLGALLRAAIRAGSVTVYGQDIDAGAARLAAAWLALHDVCGGEVRAADTLRADAFAGLVVDAVVSCPPFGDTNWGHEELGYDSRWEYGLPPRTEPELAWVQHALAHVRPGGLVVVSMPPAAASRRAGRRIRSELLRRGALRAVVALPARAAAPRSGPLHLWVLRRPVQAESPVLRVLLIDTADTVDALDSTDSTDQVDSVDDMIVAALRAFLRPGEAEPGEPAIGRAVPIVELLDQEVDLAPARRLPFATPRDHANAFVTTCQQFQELLGRLPELMPELTATADRPHPSMISIGEMVKIGALSVLTDVPAWPGDVRVPRAGRRPTVEVVGEPVPGADADHFLLRSDPEVLDPWFLAGQLRSSGNERQVASVSGSFRLDVRRARIPRLPLPEQRRLGAVFRQLHDLDVALKRGFSLGEDLVRSAVDGLVTGGLHCAQETAQPGD